MLSVSFSTQSAARPDSYRRAAGSSYRATHDERGGARAAPRGELRSHRRDARARRRVGGPREPRRLHLGTSRRRGTRGEHPPRPMAGGRRADPGRRWRVRRRRRRQRGRVLRARRRRERRRRRGERRRRVGIRARRGPPRPGRGRGCIRVGRGHRRDIARAVARRGNVRRADARDRGRERRDSRLGPVAHADLERGEGRGAAGSPDGRVPMGSRGVERRARARASPS